MAPSAPWLIALPASFNTAVWPSAYLRVWRPLRLTVQPHQRLIISSDAMATRVIESSLQGVFSGGLRRAAQIVVHRSQETSLRA